MRDKPATLGIRVIDGTQETLGVITEREVAGLSFAAARMSE
jgi:hypothetical protein